MKSMKTDERRRLLKVGAALAVAIATLIVVVAFLGKSRGLFVHKVALRASFANINGLVVGAPVRLAGVDIGIVQSIRFNRDLGDPQVHVVLGMQDKYLERIRQDSIARLGSKGLLGDVIINISVGSESAAPLRNGDTLKSQETEDLAQIAQSVHDAISDVQTLTTDVDKRLRLVLSEDVAQDLGRAVRSTANIIEKVEKGDGLLHAIIYKPSVGRDAEELLSQSQQSAGRLNLALGRMDRVLAELESGRGTLHELLYGVEGKRLLLDLQSAVREISQVVAEVRVGKGLLHEVIYKEDTGALVKDLATTAHIARTLMEETQQGKGTVGGLLKDPTVYEDLKSTLDNVVRNRLLKAIIRFAIKKDGLSREAAPAPRPGTSQAGHAGP